MKMKFGAAVVGLAAMLGVSSCSTDNTGGDDTMSFRTIEVQQSYRLTGTAVDFDLPSDLSFGCQSKLIMPEHIYGHKLDALRDSILKACVDTTGADVRGVLRGGLRNFAAQTDYVLADTVMPDSVRTVNPGFLSAFDGFYAVEGDIETLSPRYLSYAVTMWEYLPGAAHDIYGTRYINFDVEKGSIITLTTLFTPEGLEALVGVIKDTARHLEASTGPTNIERLPEDGNFYLTPDATIVFAYRPYEVASFAQGEIRIPVPAYLLEKYLSTEGTSLLL